MSLLDEHYMHASAKLKEIAKEQFGAYKKYQDSLEKGPFDKKTRELISLSASCAMQCEYCIDSHSQKARAAGATEKEIAFVILLAAATKHGATVSYGVNALK